MSDQYSPFDVIGVGSSYKSTLGAKIRDEYGKMPEGFLFLGYQDSKEGQVAVLGGLYESGGKIGMLEKPIVLPAPWLEQYKQNDILSDDKDIVSSLQEKYEPLISQIIEQAQQAQAANG